MSTEVSSRHEAEVARRARALAALADPARLSIIDALVLGDTSPGQLGERLGLTSNLLAHHLGVLEREGLLTRHRSQADRRRSYLRLRPGALAGLLPGLTGATADPWAHGAAATLTRVVFVCTANSARSQLAEALWTRHSTLPSTSAGTHPAPGIARGARAVAERHELPLTHARPQLLPELAAQDLLVTVCDNAYEDLQHVGVLDAAGTTLHWSVPDPVPVGTKEAFEDAFTDLEGRVTTLARHLTPDPPVDHAS